MGNQESSDSNSNLSSNSVKILTVQTSYHDIITKSCAFCDFERFTTDQVTILTNPNSTFQQIYDSFDHEAKKSDKKIGYTVTKELTETGQTIIKLEFFACNCETYECAAQAFRVSGGQNKYMYYGKPDWSLDKATPFKLA